ncbi:lysis protein [Xenorhabdus bovienii]|nr:lysis protein [Xenorhabdus bovienii]MDE9479893.1 lysis protein [Xenorhabdus bovienii]MDE9532825.1 lysis protein [Xenorhabdus bovienii]
MKADGKIVLVIIAGLIAWSSWLMASLNEVNDLNEKLTTDLNEQVAINTNQQARIQHLAEQDAKRLQELTNAKTEIDRLYTASLAHPERVYIKATCPVPKTPASSGMDDAATARPTDTAVGNYWVLRKHIATTEQMILGLQDYVITECYKVKK